VEGDARVNTKQVDLPVAAIIYPRIRRQGIIIPIGHEQSLCEAAFPVNAGGGRDKWSRSLPAIGEGVEENALFAFLLSCGTFHGTHDMPGSFFTGTARALLKSMWKDCVPSHEFGTVCERRWHPLSRGSRGSARLVPDMILHGPYLLHRVGAFHITSIAKPLAISLPRGCNGMGFECPVCSQALSSV
jgi:hypothetical protein